MPNRPAPSTSSTSQFLALQERLADAEDLLELRKAKRAEGKGRSISLAEVKRHLRSAS